MKLWVIAVLFLLAFNGQVVFAAGEADSPQAVVDELYDLVTFPPGSTPDWDRVRSLFIDEAVIVLRTSREASSVFSLDGFVNDFVTFVEKANAKERGFSETILSTSATVHWDIAHILVLYEAKLGESERPPTQGIDSIQLIRREDGWKIAAIVNDIVTDEHPVPEILERR